MTSRYAHIALVFTVAGAVMLLLLAACAKATPAPVPDATAQPTVTAALEATTGATGATSEPLAPAPVQPTAPAVEATAIATPASAPGLPTLPPALTLTPIPQQQIVVNEPASGATLTNPFQLSGSVALTPQDRKSGLERALTYMEMRLLHWQGK